MIRLFRVYLIIFRYTCHIAIRVCHSLMDLMKPNGLDEPHTGLIRVNYLGAVGNTKYRLNPVRIKSRMKHRY